MLVKFQMKKKINHDINDQEEDFKLHYSKCLLRDGLLDLARKDASREGDGNRFYILWKHEFLTFIASKHRNYG